MNQHPASSNRSAFTLIELLAVVAIISVILIVGLPSFTGIGRSSGMKSATTQLKTTLALARQAAITKGTKVAAVFPTMANQGGLGYRAVGLFYCDDGDAWKPLKEWLVFPQGVLIDPDDGLAGNVLDTGNGYNTMNNTIPGINNGVDVCGIVFKPDGTVGVPDRSLYLREGWISGSNAMFRNTMMTNRIIVRGLTGIASVKNVY